MPMYLVIGISVHGLNLYVPHHVDTGQADHLQCRQESNKVDEDAVNQLWNCRVVPQPTALRKGGMWQQLHFQRTCIHAVDGLAQATGLVETFMIESCSVVTCCRSCC